MNKVLYLCKNKLNYLLYKKKIEVKESYNEKFFNMNYIIFLNSSKLMKIFFSVEKILPMKKFFLNYFKKKT